MTVCELKKYIYENEKIEYILNNLNCGHIQYHENKNYYSASFPDGDNLQGINISNSEYLNFRSFSRNISYDDGKDLISLIEMINNYSFIEAFKYLHRILNLSYHFTFKKEIKKEKVNPLAIFEKHITRTKVNLNDMQFLNEDVLDDYIQMLYIGWFREGVMPWTAEKFGLAYSYKKKRVIIPMRYWLTGELLGINSRTTVENYKEFNIKKFFITPSYPKNLNLFGLYENYNEIQKAGYVVIYEAEKSVLKRHSLNDCTGVALSGHSISIEQVNILKGLNVNIIFALDKDVPIEEVRNICDKFYGTRNVYYVLDKWDLLGDKDSPADAKNKVFEFLFKNKIKYNAEEHRKYLTSLERK